VDKVAVEDVVYPIKDERSGEIIVECGHMITEAHAIAMAEAGIKSIEIVPSWAIPSYSTASWKIGPLTRPRPRR